MHMRTATGCYEQSYYTIRIDSDEHFEKVIDSNNQTFAHEYVHFLQDIFLPYNLRFNLIKARDFDLIIEKGQTGFVRPFDEWDEDSQVTQQQLQHTFGDTIFINEPSEVLNVEVKHTTIPPYSAKVFQYDLDLEIHGLYQIGARDLLEYIADKIESKHWKTDSPHFPYRTVDSIIEFKGMEIMPYQSRIAIAEMALHNDNPMHQFFFILEELKAKCDDETLASYEKLKALIANIEWESVGGFADNMHSKTERRLVAIRNSLQRSYPQHTYPDIYAWIGEIEQYVRNHMQGRFFFAELYELSSELFFNALNKIIEEIGVPIVCNSNEQVFSLLPERYDQQQFMQIYLNNKFAIFSTSVATKCTMYDFCSAANSSIMDQNCSDNPIARGAYEVLCPMGLMVKRMNLHKVE